MRRKNNPGGVQESQTFIVHDPKSCPKHSETIHRKNAFPKRTALEAGKHINNFISSQQMSKIQKDLLLYKNQAYSYVLVTSRRNFKYDEIMNLIQPNIIF